MHESICFSVEEPTGMVWLIQDQVLLVCDYRSALRVVNLEDNDVSTVCKGEQLLDSAIFYENLKLTLFIISKQLNYKKIILSFETIWQSSIYSF